MSKLLRRLGLAAGLAASAMAVPAGATILGPDAAACAAGAGESAVLVRVSGFKARTGELRVQIYGDRPEDFLAKGKRLRRIDLPVTGTGPMDVCIALPRPGDYAVAVRHDVNGDGKSGDWGDGGGFSNNPRLSILSLKPRYEAVRISVPTGVKPISVVLNYKQGLSIRPAREG